MIDWEKYHFEESILQILRGAPTSGQHPLGRSFLTSYQIAIEYSIRHPNEFAQIGSPVGGQGIGQYFSLAQYIARQLSARIQNESLPNVEGGYLSGLHLKDLSFSNSGATVVSSMTGSGEDIAIFRLIE
jgi:hypothetical protein